MNAEGTQGSSGFAGLEYAAQSRAYWAVGADSLSMRVQSYFDHAIKIICWREPENPHEKSIFPPTTRFCHAGHPVRMARGGKFSPAGFSFFGRAGRTLLAATRNGLVGLIADELRTDIGCRAFQHCIRKCARSPQPRAAPRHSSCQRLRGRRCVDA